MISKEYVSLGDFFSVCFLNLFSFGNEFDSVNLIFYLYTGALFLMFGSDIDPQKRQEEDIQSPPLWANVRGVGKALWEPMVGFVEHKWFEALVLLAVSVNIIFLASIHADQSEQFTQVMDTANIVFTVLFAVEFVLKLIAYGIVGYWRRPLRAFDGAVAIISVIDLAVGSTGALGAIFKAARAVRVLRLARRVRSLRILGLRLMRSFSSIVGLSSLVLLFVLIFALLGREAFGQGYDAHDDINFSPRTGFSSLRLSLLTTFQVLVGDAWTAVAWEAFRAAPFAGILWSVVSLKIHWQKAKKKENL